MTNVSLGGLSAAAMPQTAGIGAADPAAVQQFEAAMNAPGPTEATDAQISKLAPSDVAMLTAESGGDEHLFRTNATALLEIQNKMVQDMILKSVKKAGEKIHLG